MDKNMNRMMSHIELKDEDIFVAYSLPDDQNYYLIRQNESEIKDVSPTEPHFLFVPFDHSQANELIRIKADCKDKNQPFEFSINTNLERVIQDKSAYLNTVQDCIDFAHEGDRKVVCSRIKLVGIKGINWYDYFIELKNKYPAAFIYLLNIPQVGAWIGASPELLLSWNEDQGETMALAGTRKILNGSNTSWSQKNKDEQNNVSSYIEAILNINQIAYNKSTTDSKHAGHIEHLCNHYTLRNITDPLDLIDQLHPTSAVCGMPVEAAKKFILEMESHDRRYYSGYLGPIHIHPTNACYVNLRCMELSENQGYIYVGGGIMKDSKPDEEWQETEEKAKTLLSIIDTVYFSGHAIK